MPDDVPYDVFLSHSSKDKAVVRPLAERLRQDGVKVWFDEWVLKPGDSIPAKIEEGLEHSRVLVLCMSANAFGSDWAQLESGTFRFRDPLNKERRFLPLRLDDAPMKGSLAQFLYIDWLSGVREHEYSKLVEASRGPHTEIVPDVKQGWLLDKISLGQQSQIYAYAFSPDGKQALTYGGDKSVRVWEVDSGKCVRILRSHRKQVCHIEWSEDLRRALLWSDEENVRLVDVERDQVLADFGKTTLTKRQMDCFRLLAGGLSSIEIQEHLGLYVLTVETHLMELRRRLNLPTRNQLREIVTRFYGAGHTSSFPPLNAHWRWIPFLAWVVEKEQALSRNGEHFGNLRLCTKFRGEDGVQQDGLESNAWQLAWKANRRYAASGSEDGALRIWDVVEGNCLKVFEGHTARVESLAWHPDERLILSGSMDETVRLWDTESLTLLYIYGPFSGGVRRVAWSPDGMRAFVGSGCGTVYLLNLSEFFPSPQLPTATVPQLPFVPNQVQYTNAKVLVVGDTHAGKTGLTHRLATGEWKASEDSTVGAWSTQWPLKHDKTETGVHREIWLWDFGGQADQRLIHQLYMDRTSLILLLFNADQEDVLPGLRDWQTALRRCVKAKISHFLVAGRTDTGFKASRGKLQAFAQEHGLAYHETSAKDGTGCDNLRAAMIASIPWAQMEKRTSPRIFKLIKDEILKLRDERQVLHTFKELRELLWRRLSDEPRFTDETLHTVIGLLDGPGVVKELDYGTYILLAPEWVNAYAQAVIRTLRSAENDLGVLPLRSIAEGKLIYQSIGRDGVPVEMKRLPPAEERVVLGEMERQLEQRGLCLRQGDKLVFPSHCGRDRPTVLDHPSVFVSYAVKGFLDDIYATLVVKLADSESFLLKELWRDAADFVTLAGDHHMGLKLIRESGSDGDISVYFGKGVTQQEQVIFANYIHAHLQTSCEQAKRLRHYVCPKCHAPKGNADVLMKKLLREKQRADTECDDCGKRFPLWDALEKKFASEEVRAEVEHLQADDIAKLDTRRRGKLLALEVGARITSADQKCFEIPGTEDEGLDMELEFTNDDGAGTGRRLYLQLKSGNSHLTKRKTDGAEIFRIKEQRWVEYWLRQPHPVMLVIGTFSADDERVIGKEKLEFAEVRWMEISSVLQRESANGTKKVMQIEFKGERLDLSSVRRWRDKALSSTPG